MSDPDPLPVVQSPVQSPFVVPGKWWHADDDRIICDLCPRACAMHDGDRGFCFVRQNLGGRMMLTTYGRSTGFCIDPIEKKPLNHFYPGTSVLSFGTAGCNLGCKFCQNWDISKSREVERLSAQAMPEEIARAARERGCRSVAFTYNDPIIWAEYAIDTARACQVENVRTVAVTAGYISPEARAPFFEAMDAANVDLKAITEDFYHRITLSHIQPVLDTLIWLQRETNVWFEITNLVIPDANDKPDELRQLADWILEAVGDHVPVHFTAFHPDFRMLDRPRTPAETLNTARELALSAGLKYVYTGNVDDVSRQSTWCPSCGGQVIERNCYELGRYELRGNSCGHCGEAIAGVFDEAPGTWGRRREPVDMRQYATRRLDPTEPSMNAPDASPQLNLAGIDDSTATALLDAAADHVISCATGRPASVELPAELAGQLIDGTFVSLKRNEHLRSCCGTVGRRLPVAESIRQSAVRTATSDPRFPPVVSRELGGLTLEVWLLGPAEPVTETGEDRISAVTIGRHGLRVGRGDQSGLLLPGVATENGWGPEEFLNQTCIKAGLPPTAWREPDTQVWRFEGRVWNRALEPVEASSPNPFSAREFARYVQHCQSLVDTMLDGGVPLYYCPHVDDANVSGVAITLAPHDGSEPLTLSQISWRQSVPLQATLHSLCQNAVTQVQRRGLRRGAFDVCLLIADKPALQGTSAAPHLDGFDASSHALLLLEGNTTAFVFNRDAQPEQLLEQVRQMTGRHDGSVARLISFHVQSSRDTWSVGSRPRPATGSTARQPAVAGQFYPGDPGAMNQQLDDLLGSPVTSSTAAAVMVPHAGWQYSGRIAADVLKPVRIPERVIVISPRHTRDGVEHACAPCSQWLLPGGSLQSDSELALRLVDRIESLELDATAHQREHGIEVELPIIHRLAPDARVVGIVLGRMNLEECSRFAEGLADVIRDLDPPPLLVISSDMNHYASDAETRRLDALALAEIERRDPDRLLEVVRDNHISMCGVIPAVIVMKTLQLLGRLGESRQIAYGTSGDVSGETARVVGYAGIVFP